MGKSNRRSQVEGVLMILFGIGFTLWLIATLGF